MPASASLSIAAVAEQVGGVELPDPVVLAPNYLADTRTSLYTVEAHVRYLAEVPPDALLSVRSSVIGVTGKLLWLWHEMWCDDLWGSRTLPRRLNRGFRPRVRTG